MRRISSALLGLLFVVASMAVMTPSAAAATTEPFRLEYGNTYTDGTVTFYNRNVGVVGEQKAQSTSGCRYTEVESYSASGTHLGTNRSQITCSGSANYNFTVPANVVGGAAFVHVFLVYWTSWDDYRYLVGVRLDR